MKKSKLIFRGHTTECKEVFDTNSTGDTPKRKGSNFKFTISRLFKKPKNLSSTEECAPKKARCFSFGFWRRSKLASSPSSPDPTIHTVPIGGVVTADGMSECDCTQNNVNDGDSVSSEALGELRKTLQSLVNEVRNEGFELTSLIRQSLASARTDQAAGGQLSSTNEMSLSESGDCLPVASKCMDNGGSRRTEEVVKTPLTLNQFESDRQPTVDVVDPEEAGLSAKLQIISQNLRSLLGEVKQDSSELAALLRLSLLSASSKGSSSDKTVAPEVAPQPPLPSSRDLNEIQKNVDDLTSSVRSEARQIKSMVCESLRRRSLKDDTNWNADCTHKPEDHTLISAPTTCNRCAPLPPSKRVDFDLNGIETVPCSAFIKEYMQCPPYEPHKDGDNRELNCQQCRLPENVLRTSTEPQTGFTEGLQRLRRSIGDLAEVVRSENQQLKSVLQESMMSDHPRSQQLFADRESNMASPHSEDSLRTENPLNSTCPCHGAEATRDLSTGETDALKTIQQVSGQETKAALLRRRLHSSLVHRLRNSVASQTAAEEKLEELKRTVRDLADELRTDRRETKSTAAEESSLRPIISFPVTIQVNDQISVPVAATTTPIQSGSLPAAEPPTGDALQADVKATEAGTGLIAVLEVVGRNLLALADEVHRNSLELTALMQQSMPQASSSSVLADDSATHEGLSRLKSGINDLMKQIQAKNAQMKNCIQEALKGAASVGCTDRGNSKQDHSQAPPEDCASSRSLEASSLPQALDMLRGSVRTLTDQVHNSSAELTALLRNSVRAATAATSTTVSDQPVDRTEALQELLQIRQSIATLAEEVWSKNKRIKSVLQSSSGFYQPSVTTSAVATSTTSSSPAFCQKSDCTSCESLSLTGTEVQQLKASSKPAAALATEELQDIKKSIRELAVVVHAGKKQLKEVLCEALREKEKEAEEDVETNQPAAAEPNRTHPAKEEASNAVLLAGLERLNASMRSLANSVYSLPEFTQNATLTTRPPTFQESQVKGGPTMTDQAVLRTLEEVKQSVRLLSSGGGGFGAGQGDKPNCLIASAQAVADAKEVNGAGGLANTSTDLQQSLLLKVLETTHESLRALSRVSAPEASPEAAKKTEIMQVIAGMRDSLRSLGREDKRWWWCGETGEACRASEEVVPQKTCKSKRSAEDSSGAAQKRTVKRGKVKRRRKNGNKRLKKRDLEEEEEDEEVEEDRKQTRGDAPLSHMSFHHPIGYPQRVTTSYYAPPPMAPPMRYWRMPPYTPAVRWPPRTMLPMMHPTRWEPPASMSKASAQIPSATSATNPSADARRRQKAT